MEYLPLPLLLFWESRFCKDMDGVGSACRLRNGDGIEKRSARVDIISGDAGTDPWELIVVLRDATKEFSLRNRGGVVRNPGAKDSTDVMLDTLEVDWCRCRDDTISGRLAGVRNSGEAWPVVMGSVTVGMLLWTVEGGVSGSGVISDHSSSSELLADSSTQASPPAVSCSLEAVSPTPPDCFNFLAWRRSSRCFFTSSSWEIHIEYYV